MGGDSFGNGDDFLKGPARERIGDSKAFESRVPEGMRVVGSAPGSSERYSDEQYRKIANSITEKFSILAAPHTFNISEEEINERKDLISKEMGFDDTEGKKILNGYLGASLSDAKNLNRDLVTLYLAAAELYLAKFADPDPTGGLTGEAKDY